MKLRKESIHFSPYVLIRLNVTGNDEMACKVNFSFWIYHLNQKIIYFENAQKFKSARSDWIIVFFAHVSFQNYIIIQFIPFWTFPSFNHFLLSTQMIEPNLNAFMHFFIQTIFKVSKSSLQILAKDLKYKSFLD